MPISPETEEAPAAANPAHPSGMRGRFNWLVEAAASRIFSHVVVNDAAVRKIRKLSESGTVIYVLRHRSFVDYFLVNYVLRREGLPLPVFANGISSTKVAPLRSVLKRMWTKVRDASRSGGAADQEADHDYCARAVASGQPVLIFMLGRRRRNALGRWLLRPTSSREGSDYLREIVRSHRDGDREHYVVPFALFRGHSFRRPIEDLQPRIYSPQDLPSDTRKLVAYWWNRKDLFITVGQEVVLSDYMQRYAEDSVERMARRLDQAIKIFLRREERVVLGPALERRSKVRSAVLDNEEVQATIERLAVERNVSRAKLRKEAARYFDEMAANFNGILFAIIAYFFKKIWARMFSGLKERGFDRVVDKIRDNKAVVLVPCHRSHFDYLILTYLCHLHFVSPPHIAAGINLAFWPMAPILRGSGAYFIRRTFGDNDLYKVVFRHYLAFLMERGYTQEFFIEGGRSRTGKIMTPRMGMLSAIVNAQIDQVQRDVYLVPVSIHYGRIVEEDAYQFELSGGEKEAESVFSLLRARKFLKQRFGTVYLSFADPIYLRGELGERYQRFKDGEGVPEIEEEKRRFTQKLGFKLLRDANECTVAGATSISSTVLLGAPHGGRRFQDYADQATALARYAIAAGVEVTASLERNLEEDEDFAENASFLEASGLIVRHDRDGAPVLVVPENKRLALDFYKNNLIHVFLIPALTVFATATGKTGEARVEEVSWWLDLFRYEFALPDHDELPELIGATVERLRESGAFVGDELEAAHPLSRALLPVVDNFRESYWVFARTVRDALSTADSTSEKQLVDVYQKSYSAGLLVGEVTKAEGRTSVLMKNALSRLAELGFVTIEQAGRGGRERIVHAGPDYAQLGDLVERLRGGVLAAQQTAHTGELAARTSQGLGTDNGARPVAQQPASADRSEEHGTEEAGRG